MWGKFLPRTLELTDVPTNLASQVIVGHAHDQSRSVQSRGPERAHQNNGQSSWWLRTDRRLSRQFWKDLVAALTFKVWDNNKKLFWMYPLTMIFTRSVELGTQPANWSREDQCQRSHAHGFYYKIRPMGLLPDTWNCGLRMRRDAGNVFPATDVKGNHYIAIPACITARAWRTCRDACRDRLPTVAGKTFPAFPAHAQPAILRIWQEAHESLYTSAGSQHGHFKISNIRRTKCQNLNDSGLVLQLPVPNPLKPSIKSIIQM